MRKKGLESIEARFGELADPRVQGRIEHRLIDIIMIAICAVGNPHPELWIIHKKG